MSKLGNIIKENWSTIEFVEQKAKDQTQDPEAGFNAGTFWLGSESRHLMLPIMYRKKKGKKGQEVFTQSYKEMMIYATFCPFTGKPLYDNSNELIKEL